MKRKPKYPKKFVDYIFSEKNRREILESIRPEDKIEGHVNLGKWDFYGGRLESLRRLASCIEKKGFR